MKKAQAAVPPTVHPESPAAPSFHRSGAVARMLRMPVATLRVWERRYGVTQPLLSRTGEIVNSFQNGVPSLRKMS